MATHEDAIRRLVDAAPPLPAEAAALVAALGRKRRAVATSAPKKPPTN